MAHGWKTIRVFISSTFHDMHAERNHLVRFTFPELQERMAERHLHLRPIDLRWGVPAEDEALDVCLDAIDECRPFFIGLLGNRYGDLMPGMGRSMAALEIAHGTLDHPEGMVPFFYFRDPAVAAAIPPPHWSSYNETGEAARARLDDLKRQICDAGLHPRTYTCCWDGERNELVDLDSLGQAVLEDLWSAISERYPEGHDAAGEEESEARDALEAFVESRVQHFSGRRRYLDELHAYARERLDALRETGNGRGMVCVTGEPGVGKSSLLGKLARECAEAHPQAIVFAHFAGADAASTQVQPVLSRLWAELAREAGLREEPPRDARELVRELPGLLARAAQVRPVCLILDGLDQLDPPHLHWLPEEPPPRVAVVLSALEGEALAALRGRRKPPLEIVLGPLTKKEARDVVRDYLRQHLRKLSPRQIEALLSKPATRNPLYLLVALEELRVTGWFETLNEQIVGIPPDLPALFEELLDRLEGEHGGALVRSFLSLIAIGRGGQPEEDLRALVGDVRTVTDLAWVRLLRSLRFYLLRRGEQVDLFHQQLRLAVERRYLTEEARRECHRRAARYLQGRGFEYLRSVRELPFHLAGGGMREELYALLEDEVFRGRKLEATGSVHSICADLGLGLDAAVASRDLARTARFGFLHADYSEGRIATPDLLELHRRDRRVALREARLLRERPRFRILLLLALEDAGAGGTAAADEVVAEALSVGGVSLPDGEAPFVGDVVAALLSAACAEAWRLLRHALTPSTAARAAAAASSRVPAPARAPLLGSAVAWLRQDFVDNPGARKPLDAFAAVAEEVARLEDRDERERLVRELEGLIEGTRTHLEAARTEIDYSLAAGLLIMTAQEAGKPAEDRLHMASEIRAGLMSELGAALVRNGSPDRGEALLRNAIDLCGKKAMLSAAFAVVTRVLRGLPPPLSQRLLDRLLARVPTADPLEGLRGILEALTGDPGGAGLLQAIQAVDAHVARLDLRQRSALQMERVRAFARAGWPLLARRHAAALPPAHLAILARIPLLSVAGRIGAVGRGVELAALGGERDAAWVLGWIPRLERWVARLDDSKARSAELLGLLDLCLAAGAPDGLTDLLPAVRHLGEEDLRVGFLTSALDKIQSLPAGKRERLRGRILAAGELAGGERARCRVWSHWLAIATAEDLPAFTEIRKGLAALESSEQRALGLGSLAAVLARLGRAAEARTAWYQAALAEQGAAMPTAFASGVAAASRAGNEDAWQAVLAAVACPDLDFSLQVARVAAAACGAAERLGQLEETIARLEWKQFWNRQLFAMHLALARAWDRFGDPGRGARMVSQALERRTSAHFESEEFTSLVETGLQLAGHPLGRAVLLRLLPLLDRSSNPEFLRFPEVADCFARVPDERWARSAFHELHRVALEHEFHGEWRKVDALAAVAVGLARRSQGEVARALLHAISLPAEVSADEQLLGPAARPSALARLGGAHAEVFRATADPGERKRARDQLMAVKEAAAEVKSALFAGEACSALVAAWVEARRLGLKEAEPLRAAAEENAREAARGSDLGSRWNGLRDLARAWRSFGDGETALAALREVTDDNRREELVADVLGRGEPGVAQVDLLAWRELPSGSGRRRLAEVIAARRLTRQDPPPVAGREGRWKLYRKRAAIPVLFSASLGIACYAALILLLGPLLRSGLSGPRADLWWAGLGGAVALVLGGLTFAMWKEEKKILSSLGMAVLLALALPFFLGSWLGGKLAKLRRRLALAVLSGRERLRAARSGGWLAPRQPDPGDRPRFDQLLRAAAGEAECFDLLLASELSWAATAEEAAEALRDTPTLAVPSEVPEKIAKLERDVAEMNRSFRRTSKVREAVSKVAARMGSLLTAVLVYVPMTIFVGLSQYRRYRRARRLAVRGERLRAAGRAREGTPLLRRAAELAPDVPHFWNDYALSLVAEGRTDEAVEAYRKAAELACGMPIEADIWYGMGYTLWQARRNEEALKVFERVLEIAPPGSPIRSEATRGRGYCLQNLGRRVA